MYYVTPWNVHEDPNHSAHYFSLCICASVYTYMCIHAATMSMYVCMKTATRIGNYRCDISPDAHNLSRIRLSP